MDRAVMQRIGQRIREARERLNMTQQQLAQHFQTQQHTISEWESGKYSPHASDLPRLAEILQVPITYFFQEDEVASPPTALC